MKRNTRSVLPTTLVGVMLVANVGGYEVPLDERAELALPTTLRFSNEEGITLKGVSHGDLLQVIESLREAITRLEQGLPKVAN